MTPGAPRTLRHLGSAWAARFESSGPLRKDRGVALEAQIVIDAEEKFHRASRIVAMPCSERSVLLGWFPLNMIAVPVAMSSGPPTRPSHATCRGTSPVRYIM